MMRASFHCREGLEASGYADRHENSDGPYAVVNLDTNNGTLTIFPDVSGLDAIIAACQSAKKALLQAQRVQREGVAK